MKHSALLILLVGLTGCSNILGIEGLHGAGSGSDGGTDGTHTDGGGGDAISGPTIRLTGKVLTVDASGNSVPFSNAAIDYMKLPDDVSVAGTNADANGQYAFDVPTNISAYLHVKANLPQDVPETLMYPANPLKMDTQGDIPTYSRTAINTFANLGNAQQPQSTAFGIAVVTNTTTNMPQGNAVVQAGPGTQVRYTNNAGQPSPTLTQTNPVNGIAMMFAMVQASTTITANVNGTMFAHQTIKVGTNGVYLVQLAGQIGP